MESKLTGEEEDEINVPMALTVFRDGTGEDEWVSVSNSNKKVISPWLVWTDV